MPSQPGNIAIVGEIASLNLGDRLIAECIEGLLRDRNIECTTVDLTPKSARRASVQTDTYVADNGVASKQRLMGTARRLIRSNRTIRRLVSATRWYFRSQYSSRRYWSEAIRNVDAVIIGGGHLLTDRDFGFPPRIAAIARLCRNQGKPYAFFGCGADDWGLVARVLYARAIRSARYVSVRGERSRSVVQRSAPRGTAVHCHPDPAFTASNYYNPTEIPQPSETRVTLNVQPTSHFRRFAPGLHDLGEEDYIRFWKKVAVGALDRADSVRIVTNGDWQDWAFAKNLAGHLPGEVELCDRPTSPGELMDLLQGGGLVISTRMHCGIAAHALGANVIPIAWDRKVGETWSEASLGGRVLDPSVILAQDPWDVLDGHLGALPSAENPEEPGARVDTAIEDCLRRLASSR